ncbi:hypothetical protein HanPSC8_Chr06g0241311 [Helianthus annuus]|nr:hypothetical protein HanPSC8_Chr06g0241311 [Helianthus annuus]
MILNRSKSLSDALFLCTISFLPQELLSHLFLTSPPKQQLEFSYLGLF